MTTSKMRANLHFNCFKLKQQPNTIYWKTYVLDSHSKAMCFHTGSSLAICIKICKEDLVQLLLQFSFLSGVISDVLTLLLCNILILLNYVLVNSLNIHISVVEG